MNKLGINGSTLVMEKDGTNIDDNDVLKFCSGETFMLLQAEEFWSPQNETELRSTASADTLSLKMRNIQEFIPSKAFKIVAKNVIEKYPQIFKDMDEDGKRFGDGSHTSTQ
ncbi:hypothetical protein X777_08889 [Ooceraea biroi]|uniref:CIDE-N domain-containing protein n=1 Tax=Ooceraea biroi TaxID=2015173 RepID=A0A026W9P0_OOCBI|nr:hypothetical protein X777_08889 [Ooceraea biroi]